MGISITIDKDKISKWLDSRPDKMKRATANIIKTVAFLTERYAKINAPVDSGRLRTSIYTLVNPTNAKVSTNTNYAQYVHDGTRYMSPRPFMKDAASQVESQIDDIVEQEVRNALQ